MMDFKRDGNGTFQRIQRQIVPKLTDAFPIGCASTRMRCRSLWPQRVGIVRNRLTGRYFGRDMWKVMLMRPQFIRGRIFELDGNNTGIEQ